MAAIIDAIIVAASVFFANVFTILEPVLSSKPDIKSTIWMIAGPIFFSAVALLMYRRYEKMSKE